MEKIKYTSPTIKVVEFSVENCIANGSNQKFLVYPDHENVELLDWDSEDGFINTDFSI